MRLRHFAIIHVCVCGGKGRGRGRNGGGKGRRDVGGLEQDSHSSQAVFTSFKVQQLKILNSSYPDL